MNNEKEKKKAREQKDEKERIKPGDIQGKIEIPDTRERKDGPGGN